MPDNLVERVHQPTFGDGKGSKPSTSPPSGTKKVEKPPVKSRPAPTPRKK